MLICTKRWREPGDEFSRFMVYDTDDNTEELVTLGDIKTAFKYGLDIFGLKLKDNNTIAVDSKLMSSTSEYRYINNENTYISVRYIKVEKEETGFYFLECNDDVNEKYKRYGVVYNGELLFMTRSVPRKDPHYELGYVERSYSYISEFEGKTLVSIGYSYYDKHYYREDNGEYFSKYQLYWGSQCIKETKWAVGSLDNRIGSIVGDKLEWCNEVIPFKIWR